MPFGIVQNNLNFSLTVFLRGPVSEAVIQLAPGQNSVVNFSPGRKALIGFDSNQQLRSLRPINVDPFNIGLFLVAGTNPPVIPGGITVYQMADADATGDANIVQDAENAGDFIQEVGQ
jgi:hypothetical protein